MPLTEDIGVIEPNQLLVEVLIVQFKVLLKGIESLDKAIKEAYKAQYDNVVLIVSQVQAHNLRHDY